MTRGMHGSASCGGTGWRQRIEGGLSLYSFLYNYVSVWAIHKMKVLKKEFVISQAYAKEILICSYAKVG